MILIPFSVFICSCLIGDFLRYVFPILRINSQHEYKDFSILVSFLNLFAGTFVLYFVEEYFLYHDNKLSILKILLGLFISDTLFYWSHRLLHTEFFFRKGHLFHHRHHSPIVWTALYVHPIEFIFALIGIFILPSIILFMNSHEATVFWSIIMFSLVLSHSGLTHLSEHHDLHHQNWKYNFGSDVGIWDKLMGTNKND
jgi:sterol desaturase/sphingolipid hydroxylase (fatty acid hydroxylase superfamily)